MESKQIEHQKSAINSIKTICESREKNIDLFDNYSRIVSENKQKLKQGKELKILTSDSHRLLLNLTEKIDLRRKDKYVALSNLSIYYTWKKQKNHIKY